MLQLTWQLDCIIIIITVYLIALHKHNLLKNAYYAQFFIEELPAVDRVDFTSGMHNLTIICGGLMCSGAMPFISGF